MARFVFVTGGVVSSLGKGLTSAALGALLQARGYSVRLRKLDPYLNVDPGTMSPYEHGEVFVTDDGAETDLDLRAGRRVQIQGEQGVVLRSGESSVELEPTRVGLFAARVETKARRLVQTAGEIETRARQVFERARESFREVEDLAQTRAGRVRVVATEALRMLGRQAVVKAREDLKLRGERIYLE